MSGSNEPSTGTAAEHKEEEKNIEQHGTEHHDKPTKIPGVVQVPLLRAHGQGHGPRVAPGTKGPTYHSNVKQDLHDFKGNKLEPVTQQPLSARAADESNESKAGEENKKKDL